MKNSFYSNGKLLLTGEYVVLDGATALAIPTKYGQSLEVKITGEEGIYWKSFDENGGIWFEDVFDLKNFESKNHSNAISETLSQILGEAKRLNPNFLSDTKGIQVETKLDFPRNWGLGTSSTLINNIAQWAKVDAFVLLKKSLGGSGYDVAAAQSDFPIFYKWNNKHPEITKTSLDWDFKVSIFFVHLNKKQDSRTEIGKYNEKIVDKNTVSRISEISKSLQESKSLSEFESLIDEHELLISKTLGLATIKEQLFDNYPHSIKSLGAWGGDFVMATGSGYDMEYFKRKGYKTIIPFEEMIRKYT